MSVRDQKVKPIGLDQRSSVELQLELDDRLECPGTSGSRDKDHLTRMIAETVTISWEPTERGIRRQVRVEGKYLTKTGLLSTNSNWAHFPGHWPTALPETLMPDWLNTLIDTYTPPLPEMKIQ